MALVQVDGDGVTGSARDMRRMGIDGGRETLYAGFPTFWCLSGKRWRLRDIGRGGVRERTL